MRVRFGDFLFDSSLRELRAGKDVVHLTPKAFVLLEALLEARPRPLSKQQLHDRLWPETFVGDTNLKMLVSSLRTALRGDASTPQWVKTVYGFGYAFTVDGVEELPDVDTVRSGSILFCVLLGTDVFPLRPGANIIGREADADVVAHSTSVSRHHAVIRISGDDALIEDLGSKNGTIVGDRRITASARLKDGDRILLGSVPITFSAQPRSSSTVTG